jgi:16S rRNA G966 N2-methylase RsmD
MGLRVLHECHKDVDVKSLIGCVCKNGSSQEVAELIKVIQALVAIGVLRAEPQRYMSTEPFPKGGYDAPYVHVKILNDTKRKSKFVAGVRQAVKPDDIVLDLGTGSGILAIAAAKAGAKKVYALEPAGMIHIAKENAKRNGVGESIDFIKGWSFDLTLPEKATMLTTDIVGNDPFDMLIWETVSDAKKRLLVSDAKLIPGRIDIYAQLIYVPEKVVDQHRVTEGAISSWKEAYDIDFSVMHENDPRDFIGWYERPETIHKYPICSKVIKLGECDLNQGIDSFSLHASIRADLQKNPNGLVIFFGATLGDEYFESDPYQGDENSHWYTSIWVSNKQPFTVNGIAEFVYRYIGDGKTTVERCVL